jgi:hypothetical protein
MKCRWLLLLVLIFTASCASDGVVRTTYYGEPDTERLGADLPDFNIVDDEVITKIVTETKDASVAKEQAVHDTLQNRDKMRVEAAKNSGFKMAWQPVEKQITVADSDGKVTEIVMTEYLPNVSYTPAVEFGNPIPQEPSRHPAWDTANQFVKTTGMVTLGIVGINAISDVWQAGIAGAAATFGDNANVQGSWNTAGGNQEISTNDQFQGDFNGESSESPDEECWVDFPGGCSCESREAGNC